MSLRPALLWCFLALAAFLPAQTLRFNEWLADNETVLPDPAGDFDDWLEIYNPGPVAVQMAGLYLSDDPAQPLKWQIPAGNAPATEIAPGGFLLFWLDDQPAQGPVHAGFKISADGEYLLLTAADGLERLDSVAFGPQSADVSQGRLPDGAGSLVFFSEPTPGAANTDSPLLPVAGAPIASVAAGFFQHPLMVTFSSLTPGAQIRLTFDGSAPDENDSLFSQPVYIQHNTVVRARTFAPGYQPGRPRTYAYFIGENHAFPVVSLAFEPADFYDPQTGIYANWQALSEAERPAHADWFEPDGSPGFSLELAVELSGTGSLTLPQKSLLLKAKPAFGADRITYPVFPELPFDSYRRLVLRNSGQDWCVTHFRDACIGSLARDRADLRPILDSVHLHFQAFRPAVVYFNGEYRGIHNVREHLGEEFLEHHFQLENDEADFLDFYSEAVTGDSIAWFEFWNWLNVNHFQSDSMFQAFAAQNDFDNFTDYCIFQIAADNMDWPTKNWRRFRPRTPGGRWHWLPFDFDLSFGLLTADNQWNTGFAGQNAFARATDSLSALWPNPDWSTLPLRRALENERYRIFFLNRTADLLNTVFRPERVLARIDSFEQRYLPEIERHFAYWYLSPGWLSFWQTNVQTLKAFAQARPGLCFGHAVAHFPDDTDGTADVTLAVDPPEGGELRFSTLHFDGQHLPWTGTYFQGLPIPVQAVAAPGWLFAGWSAPALGSADSTQLTLTGDLSLTAHFVPDTTGETPTQQAGFFHLKPNPARGSVRLTVDKPAMRVVLYNSLGAEARVWDEIFQPATETPLDLLGLPAGTYGVAVYFFDGKTGFQRLVRY